MPDKTEPKAEFSYAECQLLKSACEAASVYWQRYKMEADNEERDYADAREMDMRGMAVTLDTRMAAMFPGSYHTPKQKIAYEPKRN